MRRDLTDVGTLQNDTSAQANINGNSDVIERTARASLSRFPLNADGTLNVADATLDSNTDNAMYTSLDMNSRSITNANSIVCTSLTINGTTVVPSSVASFTASADQVTFTPSGNLAATDVDAALQELDAEKQPLDATLTALAGLTIADDQVIVGTGADAFEMWNILDEDNMASDSATSLVTQQSVKAYVDNNSGVTYPPGHLQGCTISNNTTDSDHDLDIAAGTARDAGNSVNMSLGSTFVKQIDATWAVGTNAGGMPDSLVALSHPTADTWYHVFLISKSDGTTDVGFDTSVTAATLLADAAVVAATYTKYRRIGSILTDSSANICGFYQVDDWFYWDAVEADYDSHSTSGTNVTVRTPLGIRTQGMFNIYTIGSTQGVTVSSPDVSNQAVDKTTPTASTGYGAANSGQVVAATNTSSQVRVRTAIATAIDMATVGYEDKRRI